MYNGTPGDAMMGDSNYLCERRSVTAMSIAAGRSGCMSQSHTVNRGDQGEVYF